MVPGSYNRIGLSHRIRGYMKGVLRRYGDRFFPSRETRNYRLWLQNRVLFRQNQYPTTPPAGLLSILTAVWDGTALADFRPLADSITRQSGAREWVVLDNGCRNPKIISYLNELSSQSWVKVLRSETNLGITKGLRLCLEQAAGRYVLPVDGDDLLYPDALKIVATRILSADHPPLLYTDEDKVLARSVYQPYFKPDWDPILLLNSAYTAHLGVIDRLIALDVGVYSDPATEGSPDWDAFVRFFIAGHRAIHIPEVVYSWRVHAQSTADDAATKPYIHSSQRAVLQRFLDSHPQGRNFEIQYNPLFGGAPHWRFVRRHTDSPPSITFTIEDPSASAKTLSRVTQQAEFVFIIGTGVHTTSSDWADLFELHPDVVMVGGLIATSQDTVNDAGRYFGFDGICGCPYRGRPLSDPGYFGQLWKQRSVSAVSTQFAVIRSDFLRQLLEAIPDHASLAFLGIWAGAHALRINQRVAYSPFLRATSDVQWDSFTSSSEIASFERANCDIIPDRRFYSPHFSLHEPFALEESLRTLR